MASDNEASCESDPNFAVICAFMKKFSTLCGINSMNILELQDMLENTQEVSQELIDLHIKLLRKSRKSVSNERWEKAIVKFCHGFCLQDAWEIERFGYKKARLSSKLRVLKELLEMQFDFNTKFKTEVNKMSADELRSQPLGRDKHGHVYWFQDDNNCQIRVYKEDPDEETWKLVARDRNGLASLITDLGDGDSKISSESERMCEDDSNSLAEKPTLDTGQSSDSNKKIDESDDSSDCKKNNISVKENIEELKKRIREDKDEMEESEAKRMKLNDVSDEIEEPLMLVTGNGTGVDNESPIVIGDVIEEAVMYIYGNGNGNDCETGNEKKTDNKTETNNTETVLNSELRTNSECCTSTNKTNSIINDGSASKQVPTSPTTTTKSTYKLGTIIDTKTDNNKIFPLNKNKKSRWDVETVQTTTTAETNDDLITKGHVKDMVNKWEEQINDETDSDKQPKKTLFFFGPGCLSFKSTIGTGHKVPNDTVENEKIEQLNDIVKKSEDRETARVNKEEEIKLNLKNDDKICNKIVENQEIVQQNTEHKEIGVVGTVENKEVIKEIEKEEEMRKEITEIGVEKEEINKATENKETEITEKPECNMEISVKISKIIEKETCITETIQIENKEELKEKENSEKCDTYELSKPDQKEETIIISEETSKEDELKQTEDNLVPVIEEPCIKKYAYTVGEEETDEDMTMEEINKEDTKKEKNEQNVVQLEESQLDEKKLKETEENEITGKSCETFKSEKTDKIIEKRPESPMKEDIKELKNVDKVEDKAVENIENTGYREKDGLNLDNRKEERDIESKTEEISVESKIEKEIDNKIIDDNKFNKDLLKMNKENYDLGKIEIKDKPYEVSTMSENITNKCEIKENEDTNKLEVKKINNKIEQEKLNVVEKCNIDVKIDKAINEELMENKVKEEIVVNKQKEEIVSELKENEFEQTETEVKENKTVEIVEDQLEKIKIDSHKTEIANETINKQENFKEEVKDKENTDLPETKNEKIKASEVVFLNSGSDNAIMVESSNSSSDVLEVPETTNDNDDKDPLAISSEKTKEEEAEDEKPMTLSTFSLDFNDTSSSTPITRNLRKRSRDSTQIKDNEGGTPGKKIKMKGKRSVDVKLRKSIEEQRKELVSSDDDHLNDDNMIIEEDNDKKTPPKKKLKNKNDESTVCLSSDIENTPQTDTSNTIEKPVKKYVKNAANKNKRLLLNLGINPDNQQQQEEEIQPVRQSRRIAQIKIKEEAERRKLEEELLRETQEISTSSSKKKKNKKNEDKDYKSEKRKIKSEEDDTNDGNLDKKKKKKKKRDKDPRKLFNESKPWQSSSDSSTSNDENDEDDDDDGIADYSDDEPLQFKSDHEFSPESDLENETDAQPLKRARTVKKESDVEEEIDDCPCQKCKKSDHPEWILLCDNCDNGWHCSCLRPPLLVIPEGDWFCPPCQHTNLLNQLQLKLKEFDRLLNKKEIEDRRKERLAYVGISLNNVLPSTKEREQRKKSNSRINYNDTDTDITTNDDNEEVEEDDDEDDGPEVPSSGDEVEVTGDDDDDDDDEDDDEGESEVEERKSISEELASDSDEPIYQLRQRRQAHSYHFNDYDELINSAIQDEMEAVKGAGNQGRGKDIATIVNAEKEEGEEGEKKKLDEQDIPLNLSADNDNLPQVPVEKQEQQQQQQQQEEEHEKFSDDDDVIKPMKKRSFTKKKHRKLNCLDISSEDEDSDEDFKGTSSESEEEFDAEDLESEDSSELDTRRGGKRRNLDPIRRSTRARTSRYDADFIDDRDTDDQEEEEPKKKKKRSIWDESESEEESDRSWGRRKRKPSRQKKTPTTTTSTQKKRSTKKKKKSEDSDVECYKKKKPKIKITPVEGEEVSSRRTRGKKINFLDALGSDSDEERTKRPTPKIESEEEYVVNEDEMNRKKMFKKNNANDEIEDEPNPIDVINRNLEEMDENEMEKMMEEEDYANKQLQLVALQLEKEKKRKEREAKKLEVVVASPVVQQTTVVPAPKKRGRKPKNQLLLTPTTTTIISQVNTDNNDELSEPPGVSLPLFDDLNHSNQDDDLARKQRRGHSVINRTVDGQEIEVAAPPQPFSQSQPTPSVITRMLQSKQIDTDFTAASTTGIGTIRTKQFATINEQSRINDDGGHVSVIGHHSLSPGPPPPGQYIPAAIRGQLPSPFRQLPPGMNHHYPRGTPPPPQHLHNQPHIYHTHRSLDPSPSGGGPINIGDSPGRVVSPATSSPGSVVGKNETPPPPPYVRPSQATQIGRFPLGHPHPRHLHMVGGQHLPTTTVRGPYTNLPPANFHYSSFPHPQQSPLSGGGVGDDALPPTTYQSSHYPEHFDGVGSVNQSENSNSKSFDEGSGGGGEFGGLVSYFSSQREDDLES